MAVKSLMLSFYKLMSYSAGDRCQSRSPSSDGEDADTEVVRRTAKEYFYRHRGSFSGPTMVNSRRSQFTSRKRYLKLKSK